MTLLRYTGSKAQLASLIAEHIGAPELYCEPFLGAAHVALALPMGTRMVLNDASPHVANFWQMVKLYPVRLAKQIDAFKSARYVDLRSYLNSPPNDPDHVWRAAIFHITQARCFNGVMRVNKSGKYNVPEGKNRPIFATEAELVDASARLANAVIYCNHWRYVIPYEPCTVYMDPPYLGQHSSYTEHGFGAAEHAELASFATFKAAQVGSRVLISNSADTPPYVGFERHMLYPTRSVGGQRGTKGEALWISKAT